MLLISLTIFAFIFYTLSSGYVISRLFHREGPNQKFTLIFSTVAILAHLLLLINSVFIEGGQDLSFVNVSLLICWIIVVSVTTVSLKFPATLLLPVVYSFSALLLIVSLFLPHDVILKSVNVDIGLLIHISVSFLAYCILIISSLYAIQFYFINVRLKQKDLGIVYSHLPPLMLVEQQFYQLVTVGTLLLTLALGSGFVFLNNMFATEYAHKTVLSLLAWFCFSGVVIGHHLRGWRGKMSIMTTIIAAFLLTLAYFGSRFVKEIILSQF